MARKQLVNPRAPWNRWLFCLLLIGFVGPPFLASNTETHAASRTQEEAWPDPLVQQNGIVVRDRVIGCNSESVREQRNAVMPRLDLPPARDAKCGNDKDHGRRGRPERRRSRVK